MKKILIALLTVITALSAIAQDNSPAMLKKKELFAKSELFENPAIFSNRNANAELLKDFEAKPSSYAPEQLMPIVTCYMAFGDIAKAKSTLETFLKASPKNIRAIRTMGTIFLLEKNTDKAGEYFKKAYDAGDVQAAAYVASTFIISKQLDKIAPYVNDLKKLAKDNLEAFNICMIYSLRDQKNPDKSLQAELIKNLDARKAMMTVTIESFNTVLRIYLADRDQWTTSSIVIPARAAAFAEAWPIALEAYTKALNLNPNDSIALRGMGLVAYRTGDVRGAADYVMKAYNNGDKDSAIDGVELFLLSQNMDIWNKFKPYLKDVKFTPQLRAGLIQYASRNDKCGEIFYTAIIGSDADTDILYKDNAVRALIEECLKKYGDDKRASAIATKVLSVKSAK